MTDKKEVKRLLNYAKKIVTKQTYRKLKNLKTEKQEPIKYAINARLNEVYDYLERRVKKMKKQGKDVFFIETKMHTLKAKIKLFTATYHKRDFISVRTLFKEVQKEMKNV